MTRPPAPPAHPLPPWADAPDAPPRARRWPLVLPQVAYALFLVLWFPLSVAATMGLANTPAWWAPPALLGVWLYPVALLVAVVVSHLLLSRRPGAARLWNLLPLPWVVVGLGLLVWIFSSEGFS